MASDTYVRLYLKYFHYDNSPLLVMLGRTGNVWPVNPASFGNFFSSDRRWSYDTKKNYYWPNATRRYFGGWEIDVPKLSNDQEYMRPMTTCDLTSINGYNQGSNVVAPPNDAFWKDTDYTTLKNEFGQRYFPSSIGGPANKFPNSVPGYFRVSCNDSHGDQSDRSFSGNAGFITRSVKDGTDDAWILFVKIRDPLTYATDVMFNNSKLVGNIKNSINADRVNSLVATVRGKQTMNFGNFDCNLPELCYPEALQRVANNSFDDATDTWCDYVSIVDSAYLTADHKAQFRQACTRAYCLKNCHTPYYRYRSNFDNRFTHLDSFDSFQPLSRTIESSSPTVESSSPTADHFVFNKRCSDDETLGESSEKNESVILFYILFVVAVVLLVMILGQRYSPRSAESSLAARFKMPPSKELSLGQ